jgi:hypothetical protein
MDYNVFSIGLWTNFETSGATAFSPISNVWRTGFRMRSGIRRKGRAM